VELKVVQCDPGIKGRRHGRDQAGHLENRLVVQCAEYLWTASA